MDLAHSDPHKNRMREKMTRRMMIPHAAAEGFSKVSILDQYCHDAVESELVELIYLRASQLNGCAFCTDSHSLVMQDLGIPDRKIFAIGVWKESPFFTDRERLVLELTEVLTHIVGRVSDELWDRLSAEFTEKELADIVLSIGTINLWNRIGISTYLPTPALSD